MRAAAAAAQADEFVAALPEGYETVVGERGFTLSGGQRQRLAIARALVMDPRILILDDATSSVDVETEFRIREALVEVMKGRTTFIIAHRPSTISLADEVVVLDHGRIVERGAHDELMAAGGTYAQMFGDAEAQHCDLDAVPVDEAGRRRRAGLMATASRNVGPHGSGATVEELRGWHAFLHLARELRLARLARFAYPYRRRALLSVVAMVVVVLTSLSVPYLVKVGIDRGIDAGDLRVLDLVIVAFVAVSAVNLGASYAQTYLTSWVGEHVVLDLRRTLFAHIQKLSMDFFSRQKTGWIVSRLTNDIDALSQLVTEGVTSLVTNSLTFIGAIVFLFILDWRLALATMSIMPLVVGATLVFRTRSARAYALVRERIANVSAHLQESISGVRVLKAFRREAADRAALDRANAAYRDVNMRTVVQSGVYFPFVEFMSAAGVVIVLWYGGSLVSDEALEIGVLVAFIGYLASFFDPLQQLSQLYNTFQASMAAVQKIFAVLDTEPDMLDAPDAVPLPDVAGELELRDVTFGVRGRRRRSCTT